VVVKEVGILGVDFEDFFDHVDCFVASAHFYVIVALLGRGFAVKV